MAQVGDVFYRYEGYSGGRAEFSESWIMTRYSAGHHLQCHEYLVKRVTPKGVVLDTGFNTEKFVLLGCRKQWAYPDQLEALNSFAARKRRQIQLLEQQLEAAKAYLACVKPEWDDYVRAYC